MRSPSTSRSLNFVAENTFSPNFFKLATYHVRSPRDDERCRAAAAVTAGMLTIRMLRLRALGLASAVSIVFLTASSSAAPDDDDFYEGRPVFLWEADFSHPHNTQIEACQAGVKDFKGQRTFAGVRKGPTDDADHWTCIFHEKSDGSEFAPDGSVTKALFCHNNAEANYEHGGKKMCKYNSKDSCKDFRPKGPGKDTTARCKPAKSQSDDAKELARQRAYDARANAPQRWIDCYEQAKAEIAAEQTPVQAKNNKDQTANPYPDYADNQLFPDGVNTVDIGLLCGTNDGDFAAANNIAGYATTPVGKELQKNEKGEDVEVEVKYTWHHHQDLGKMQLVKTLEDHKLPHTGGRAIWKRYLGGY